MGGSGTFLRDKHKGSAAFSLHAGLLMSAVCKDSQSGHLEVDGFSQGSWTFSLVLVFCFASQTLKASSVLKTGMEIPRYLTTWRFFGLVLTVPAFSKVLIFQKNVDY